LSFISSIITCGCYSFNFTKKNNNNKAKSLYAHHNSETCLETHNELRNACQIIEGVCVPLNFIKFKKEKDDLLSDGEGNQYHFNRN
jgi:hypothetical protein